MRGVSRYGIALIGLATALAAAPSRAEEMGGAAAAAIEAAAASLAPNRFVWNDPGPTSTGTEPVTVVVSLPLQRAYVYRGTALVAATAVSTGREDKATPVGIYPILQKAEAHRSNLYDGAPMPFMQRLTWDGIALHAGKNPGFPDSHGCVRLPAAFARRLFAVTDLGTTVVVTDQEVGPGALDVELTRTDAQRANEAQLALAGAGAAGAAVASASDVAAAGADPAFDVAAAGADLAAESPAGTAPAPPVVVASAAE